MHGPGRSYGTWQGLAQAWREAGITDVAVIEKGYLGGGNTGRNTLHGPPQRRIDLSLFKNVPIHNNTRLQLRAEVFNITNTPSFATPNANFGTAGFGSITSTGNAIPRQMQFAAKLLF